MNKTSKCLTGVIALMFTVPSFPMWQCVTSSMKNSTLKTWNLLKTDIRSPRRIALKSCAGIGAGTICTFTSFIALENKKVDNFIETKQACDFQEDFRKKFKEKKYYYGGNLMFSSSLAAAAIAGGPIGLTAWCTGTIATIKGIENILGLGKKSSKSN